MATVAEIMSTQLLTIQQDVTAGETINKLAGLGFSAAPVVNGEEMVGIVSELELFDVLFDPDLRQRPITEFMIEEVITVQETTTLGQVAQLFALHGIRRMPVVREGVPVGIVSRRDLLKFASQCDEPLVDPLSELMTDLADA